VAGLDCAHPSVVLLSGHAASDSDIDVERDDK